MARQELNLTPSDDSVIALIKYDTEICFPDRIPASLLPAILAMRDDATGRIVMSEENITRIFQIIVRLIKRANPQLDEQWILDFIDFQDLEPIIERLLNPQEPSSTPAETATPVEEGSRKSTRKQRQ